MHRNDAGSQVGVADESEARLPHQPGEFVLCVELLNAFDKVPARQRG
jgi:hypothetical protein